MGVKITELMIKKEIEIDDLAGKTIAIDSSLFLYQFLSTIRQRDGSLLMDSKGNVTSHLSGLFFRTLNLMQKGLELVFVFDGKSPELKSKEKQRRAELKQEAKKKYEIAKKRQDIEEMKKFASRTSKLTKEMIEESKELIEAMGLSIVQAPAEAEAQAAFMVKNNDCYAVATQDADCLLFGSPQLLRNLSIAGKKKKTNKLSFDTIKPELIELKNVLDELEINQDQLIIAGILVGTDFNIGGVPGIGQKNAIKLVKEFKDDFEGLFEKVEWDKHFDFSWKEVFDIIKNMPVTKEYSIKTKELNETKIKEILIKKHEFSEIRVNNAIKRLDESKKGKAQKGLSDFF